MRTLIHTVACALLLGATNAAAQPQTESLSGNAEQIWHGTAAGANTGQWLDLGAVSNGDSRTDLIIGAPGSASIAGAVYVIFGGPVRNGNLSLANADTIISGAAAGDAFGFTTAAGNVITLEGSQTRNLVIAAPDALGGKGAIYVYLGAFALGAHLTTADATYTVIGRPGDHLGTALATADLDNDGYREIIVGAGGNDRMYVLKGGAGLSGTRDLNTSASPLPAPDLEVAGVGLGDVLAAGDVTGDGIADLLVGASDFSSGTGIVYLYKGRASGGIPTTPDAAFGGMRPGDRAGSSLRLLDIDHDGIRDIMIGAPNNDGPANDRADAGAVHLIWGVASLASRDLVNADVTFFGAAAGLKLGTHISAGDINRDTPSDIVMMGPGSGGAGELDVYYGRSNRSSYGTDAGGGRRYVDFADQAQIDRKIVGDAALGSIVFTQVFEVTGEGARDIVASVPSQDGSTGAVYFTISPSLVLSATTVNLAVNKNGSGASAPIAITNRSIIQVTWGASSNQPWLTPTPAAGSTTSSAPGHVVASVNAAGMAPGTYSGTMTVASTSKHLEMSVPVTVNLAVTDTRITIDTPPAAASVRQPFIVGGWAIDLASSTGTGVDMVHVYAARNDGSGTPAVFVGVATYGAARSDIGALFGARFTNSGFNQRVIGLAPGPWKFLAYAHSTVSGSFTAVAERDVTITPTPITPGADLDGDLISDPTLYKANGDWSSRTSASGFTTTVTKSWGGAGYAPVPGDYDGDGKMDYAVYRESTGDWYVLLSNAGFTTTFTKNFGGAGYKPVAADYDGDRKMDLGVYNIANGYWYILTSSSGFTAALNASWGGAGYIPVPGTDFDGDGRADIALFYPNAGVWYVLKSTGSYATSMSVTTGTVGNTIVTGDFDGDGKTDPGFYNRGTGRWYVAKSSTNYTTVFDVTFGGTGYAAVPGDFDGDGRTDMATFLAATGTWAMRTSFSSFAGAATFVSGFGAGSDIAVSSAIPFGTDDQRRATDVDADGKADLTVYNTSTGTWYTLKSGAGYTTAVNTPFGGSGYQPVPGDFDGDGKADRALYQQSSGYWYVLFSSSNFTTSTSKNLGGAGWTAAPGDYDGDGKTDFVVYNGTTGQWYGLKSASNYTTTVNMSWGGTGQVAAPADFDGDGKTDLSVYQAASGSWFVLLSGANYTTALSKSAGGPAYSPVAADYDGDGRADFGAYNTTTGGWIVLTSVSNYTTNMLVSWGGTGYVAVKGDYDGDGRADLALYHAASGNWYILLSAANYTSSMVKNWGGSGYAAVPMYP